VAKLEGQALNQQAMSQPPSSQHQQRPVDSAAFARLRAAGQTELMARLLAARGVSDAQEIDTSAHQLLPPDTLKGIQDAARLMAQALLQNLHICVVADYDCDGATACAVGLRGLRMLGARQTSFVVPDRRRDGYGLTPAIAQQVRELGADVLVTVDNGIASVDGVRHALSLGLQVLVTDHHLPGPALPPANAIVNPNQPGCNFASKHLAGVGVMFYVLLATRAWLRQQGHFARQPEPRLDTLLPLVALGTVADVVTLDANNRRLVQLGLERIRRAQMPEGLRALLDVSARPASLVTSQDLGFAVAPRINAAGRLSHMRVGIECLLTDDPDAATRWAHELDDTNRERREVEAQMREQALALVSDLSVGQSQPPAALCLFDPGFHEGVIGIVAGRLKDLHHRPAFVFAPAQAQPGWLKGSGRSIAGFHLRDALDAMSKQAPEMMSQFGGHAMAAGCTLQQAQLAQFESMFQQLAQQWLAPEDLQQVWLTDGDLSTDEWQLQHFLDIERQVWGAGFSAPLFCSRWTVVQQRIVGQNHLKLGLTRPGLEAEGIWFGRSEPAPDEAVFLYRPQINRWQGRMSLQVQIVGLG
jgi:single-stranded-DNA-specific exonuclease